VSNREFEGFVEFVKSLARKKQQTIGGRSFFTVKVVSDGFIFTPLSTKKERKARFKGLESFFIKQRRIGSFITTEFLPAVNASYCLSLIRSYDNNVQTISLLDLNDKSAIEGYMIDFNYFRLSRNKDLAEDCKQRDKHTCQACGFKLELNGRYIVDCHHKYPLSMTGETETKLEDLVSLCPTCHRVAHLENPPIKLARLKLMSKKA
jgi:hypothetical protein